MERAHKTLTVYILFKYIGLGGTAFLNDKKQQIYHMLNLYSSCFET